MAGFLYYLPGYTDVGIEEIKAAKLGYAFGRRCTSVQVIRGPDDKNGVVVADEGRMSGSRIGYYRDAQAWRVVPGKITPGSDDDRPWVGYYVDHPPTPGDLARERMLEGHRVTLGDENVWQVPLARGCRNDETELAFYQALPTGVGVDDEGNWIADGVLPKYAVLWQIASLYWTAFRAAADGDWEELGDELAVHFDLAEAADKALTVLAANYYLGKIEAAVLGLFSDTAISSVFQALVDWPGIQEWLQKKKVKPD